MTDPAVVGLVAGVVVLAVVLVVILVRDRHAPAVPDTLSDDQQIAWSQKAKVALDDFGLEKERALAGKWAASAAALLGILSTVAVVAGPDDLVEHVGGDAALVAGILILLAAAIAAVAILLAALAEQGTPVLGSEDGGMYRALVRTRAHRARHQIWWSRLLTVIALCLVVAATGVAWLKALAPAEKRARTQSVLVVTPDGAQCGALEAAGTSVVLKAGSRGAVPITNEADLTLVDSCP